MKKIFVVLLFSLVVTSCSKDEASSTNQSNDAAKNKSQVAVSKTPVKPTKSEPLPATQVDFDFDTVVLGGKVYQKTCAACHGKEAKGEPDWRVRKPDGKLKPPPLNGTGHMWHHSKELLLHIIKNGTMAKGGGMPAWGDKLSDKEMEAAFLWLQSKWPKEVYKSWLEINKR